MTGREALERDLRTLAATVDWPETPDLAAGVRTRLEGEAARSPHGVAPRGRWSPRGPTTRVPRSPLALAAAILLVLLIAAALVPPARSAVLRVLGLTEGASVVRVQRPPRSTTGPLGLGRPVRLEQARRQVAFRLRLPATLGRPERTRYSAAIAGGAVSLYWPGYVLTQFQGGGIPYFRKFAGPGTTVRPVRIGAARGYFLSGAPHEVLVVDRTGQPITGERALVHAHVLLWDAGGIAFRLETRRGLRDALTVARATR